MQALHNIPTRDIVARYEEVFEIYKNTNRKQRLSEIESKIFDKQFEMAEEMLKEFLTEKELMFALETKLKGKPISRTLSKIRKGNIESRLQIMKGLSSLMTHSLIECEDGNMEYMYVAKKAHQKLSELMITTN